MKYDMVETNPVRKSDDLIKIFAEYNAALRQHEDAGFEWLGADDKCVVIKNPRSDHDITVVMEEQGEFTLYFGNVHCHYDPDEEDYSSMVDTVFNILGGKICSASIHYGKEEKWLGSMFCSKEEAGSPLKKTFHFVFRQREFKEKIKNNGGVAHFTFWDPADSRAISIGKEEERK